MPVRTRSQKRVLATILADEDTASQVEDAVSQEYTVAHREEALPSDGEQVPLRRRRRKSLQEILEATRPVLAENTEAVGDDGLVAVFKVLSVLNHLLWSAITIFLLSAVYYEESRLELASFLSTWTGIAAVAAIAYLAATQVHGKVFQNMGTPYDFRVSLLQTALAINGVPFFHFLGDSVFTVWWLELNSFSEVCTLQPGYFHLASVMVVAISIGHLFYENNAGGIDRLRIDHRLPWNSPLISTIRIIPTFFIPARHLDAVIFGDAVTSPAALLADHEWSCSASTVGLVLAGVGVVIVGMALGARERVLNFSQDQVKDETVYAYVRHPGYAGSIVALFGISLVLQTWTNFLLVAYCIVFVVLKSKQEEVELQKDCEGYSDYCKRVRAKWIPGIF